MNLIYERDGKDWQCSDAHQCAISAALKILLNVVAEREDDHANATDADSGWPGSDDGMAHEMWTRDLSRHTECIAELIEPLILPEPAPLTRLRV
jgi:hypothetical protein